MLLRVSKGDTCLGGWLGQVKLAINALLVKRFFLRGNTCPAGSGRGIMLGVAVGWVRCKIFSS